MLSTHTRRAHRKVPGTQKWNVGAPFLGSQLRGLGENRVHWKGIPIDNDALFDDQVNDAIILRGLQRVLLENQQVGDLAGLNRAQVVVSLISHSNVAGR